MTQFSYCTVANARSTLPPERHDTTFEQFAGSLKEPALRAKKDGPAFIFANFGTKRNSAGNLRWDGNVTEITGFALDLDRGISEQQIRKVLAGHTYVAHTTHSHTEQHPKWRVIFPLLVASHPKLAKRLFEHLNGLFGGQLDPACKNPSRLYYQPACPIDKHAIYRCFSELGAPLDPTPFLALGKIRTPKRSDLAVALEGAIEGERDDLLFRLACRLRASGVPQQKAEEIVLLAASKCSPPFDPDDARRKVASAWRYASNCVLTDLSNSLRLTHRYAGKIRYAFKLKKWIYWDTTRWCIDDDGQVSRYARATVMAIYEEITANPESAEDLLKHAKQSQQVSRLDAMERLARTEEGIPIAPEYLDADQWLIGTPQGVIDLKTGTVRDPKPEDLITKSTNACLHVDAQCDRWLQFLLEIMGGKAHMVQFLQRAIGYTLTGSTKEQCLFFLYGSGANGKSTLLNILGHVLGNYAIRSPAETLVTRRERGVPNDVARMHGSRLVITSEIEEGTFLAESLVKQLTGGDRLVARYLFAEFFEFVPAFKIWLAANHKPRIRGDDFAIWRRIRLIPFLAEFPPEKQDPELLEALLKEDAGILAWALQGCLEWQRSGLQPPEEVMAATAAYRSEMDTFKQWLDERCEIDASPGSALEVKSSELYQNYTTWAKSNGLYPASAVRFASRLSDRGLNKLRKKGGIFYLGIRLKGPDEPDM